MSLTSTQLPLLHGAEHRRLAVLHGKRQAFTISFLLVIAAIIPNLIVSVYGQPNFPGRWAYWVVNGVVLVVSGWALIAMRRDMENVRVVQWVGLIGSLSHLLAWDVLALAAHYEPRAEFLMTSVAVFLLTNALLCLVVERRYLPFALAGVFIVHELLLWGNLLQFPWGSVHTAQLTSDLLVVVATLFLNLIGSFQHLISTSQQETEVVRLLVNTDELTGLANARSISAQLEALPSSAVLLLEVDDFEGLLIDLGEDVADTVFFQFARTLRREVGRHGSCGRWGNNQFVVLLPYAERQVALGMAELLRQKLTALEFGEAFTLSVGVAVPRADLNGIDLLHVAARHLAAAQASGGDRIVANTAKVQVEKPAGGA